LEVSAVVIRASATDASPFIVLDQECLT